MAAGKVVRTPNGWTRFNAEPGQLAGSGIILQDQDGNDWGISVDTTGDLRVFDADDLNGALDADSDGVVAGGQS